MVRCRAEGNKPLTPKGFQIMACFCSVGDRIRGTLGDIDPLNKVPVKRARRGLRRGSRLRVPLLLPRIK